MLDIVVLSDVFRTVDLNIHAANWVDRDTLKDRLAAPIVCV
ncbi:hypothetical protein MACH05_07260 [Qipengyuania nanhaisediminis]